MPTVTFNVEKITIVRDKHGIDTIFLKTDLPCGTWPWEDKGGQLKTVVANGMAEEYVETYFPGIPYKVLEY